MGKKKVEPVDYEAQVSGFRMAIQLLEEEAKDARDRAKRSRKTLTTAVYTQWAETCFVAAKFLDRRAPFNPEKPSC